MTGVWIKRLGLGAAAVAVVAGFAYALREQPVLVDAAAVAAAPMQVTVREEGVTRVRDVYTISAPIAGHLARTLLEEGDPVAAGETVVASIEPLDPPLIDKRTEAELVAAREAARSAVAIAETDLKRARAALKLAEEEQARALKLYGPGIISESALQKAESEVELRRAQVDAAHATIAVRKAELATAEARLMPPERNGDGEAGCCVSVTAPVDGVVLEVFAKSEQAVAVGTRIAEIGDPAELEIVVDLLSADAVRIRPGADATITDWGGDAALAATVRRVDPAAFTKVSALGIEEQRVNAVLDLAEAEPRLGHGYRVFAEMTVWECARCLQVPISALFRAGDGWSVFVVGADDRVRRADLQIGRMNDETAEVLSGLAPGDVVVLHPSDTIEDGTLVDRRIEG